MILWQLLREMLEALDYLAFRSWCHRDVKCENILYTVSGDNGYLFQLADFGFAN
jgi:serine/threonine protein kinase